MSNELSPEEAAELAERVYAVNEGKPASLNGDSLVDVTSSVLRMIKKFKKEFITDGKWVIPFADFAMTTQEGQNLTSLVTLPDENVILEVATGAPTADQTVANSAAYISTSLKERARQQKAVFEGLYPT